MCFSDTRSMCELEKNPILYIGYDSENFSPVFRVSMILEAIDTLKKVLLIVFYDLIDESVFEGFFDCHEIVSITIGFDLFYFLSRVMGEYGIEFLSCFYDMFGCKFYVGGLSFCSTEWLMNHDFRV